MNANVIQSSKKCVYSETFTLLPHIIHVWNYCQNYFFIQEILSNFNNNKKAYLQTHCTLFIYIHTGTYMYVYMSILFWQKGDDAPNPPLPSLTNFPCSVTIPWISYAWLSKNLEGVANENFPAFTHSKYKDKSK